MNIGIGVDVFHFCFEVDVFGEKNHVSFTCFFFGSLPGLSQLRAWSHILLAYIKPSFYPCFLLVQTRTTIFSLRNLCRMFLKPRVMKPAAYVFSIHLNISIQFPNFFLPNMIRIIYDDEKRNCFNYLNKEFPNIPLQIPPTLSTKFQLQ